jgi:hypothetical protein
MNVVFRWRALNAGRVYLRQNPSEAKMSASEMLDKLKDKGFMKKVLAFSGSMHGSASYWHNPEQSNE